MNEIKNCKNKFWICFVATATLTIVSGCQQLRHFYPRTYLGSKDTNSTLRTSEATLNGGGPVDLHLAWAQAAEERGDPRGAEKIYRDILRQYPDNFKVHHRLAVVLDKLGDSQQASDNYQFALAQHPNHPELLCDYGYSLYLQEAWPDAETHLRNALELQPNMLRAHTNLALLFARTGRLSESLAEFHQAGCSKADAQSNVGIVLMDIGEYASARRYFELALQTNPKHVVADEGASCVAALLAKAGQSSGQLTNEKMGMGFANIGESTANSDVPDLRTDAPAVQMAVSTAESSVPTVRAALPRTQTGPPADSALVSKVSHSAQLANDVNFAEPSERIRFSLPSEEKDRSNAGPIVWMPSKKGRR